MTGNTGESNERKSSRRRKLFLLGCGGLLLSILCLAGIGILLSFLSSGPEDAGRTNDERASEAGQQVIVDGGIVYDDEGTAQEEVEAGDVSGETTRDDTRTERSNPSRTPAATDSPQPTETATPPPQGMSRRNPFGPGTVVSAPNWDVEVLEVIRGEEAWSRLQAANQFNEPAPPGMEYFLVNIQVKSTYADQEVHRIGGSDFKITGDGLACYSSAPVVAPEPELDAELGTGGEAAGWVPFLVAAGESNLMLAVDELLSFDEDRIRYIALQEEAAVEVDPALADIDPTELGRSRQNTVPLAETATNENWQVTVLEVIRGEEAWSHVQAANQFNEPPAEGMEYVLMRVRVRNISTVDSYRQIDEFAFNATGSANIFHDVPGVVTPDPVFDACLYPGGQAEGWVTLQAYAGETNLMAVFEPSFESFDGTAQRFMALEAGASVSVPQGLSAIEPNGAGVEKASPAAIGETVIVEDWEVTVREVVRGDQAWTMAQEANQFNDPPAEGMEYIAVRLYVRYIGTEDQAEYMDEFAFHTISDLNIVYDIPSVVDPEPALEVRLYPGGTFEGWAVFQAAEGESNVLLVFSSGFFSGERYLTLEP